MTSLSAPKGTNAKFLTGSTMRHVVVMTVTASLGLMAIFIVDFADLYFLSLLSQRHVAALGYASSILFFTISIGIGLSIAATALVSRAVGAGEEVAAKRLTLNSIVYTILFSIVCSIVIWIFLSPLLQILGAEDETHDLALSYLRIIVPSMPFLSLAIATTGLLRAVGDAKLSMYVTLSGGLVNAVLDPIFIFTLGLGMDGAAFASVVARVVSVGVGLYGVVIKYHLLPDKPKWSFFEADWMLISGIAFPAMLTNIATPIGNAYVTYAIDKFGEDAVAGWSIVGRLLPVAFGTVFALSGAVGPIIGQNLGAKDFPRVRRALTDALIFSTAYVAAIWVILAWSHPLISAFFSAKGDAAELVRFFCVWLSPSFAFMGALFVANAAFNNLGKPHYSTAFNWGRSTLGVIPFVILGASWFGASGVLSGYMWGALFFGLSAVWLCYRLIDSLSVASD